MCEINEITLSKYYDELREAQGERTLLFGNGLGLSHPDPEVRRVFEFDGLRTSIDIKQFLCNWIFQNHPSNLSDLKNPEIFLQIIRLKTILEVLDGYMKRIDASILDAAIKKYEGNIIGLLTQYKRVFSLNYDVISYHFFRPLFNGNKRIKFKDGFIFDKEAKKGKSSDYIEQSKDTKEEQHLS